MILLKGNVRGVIRGTYSSGKKKGNGENCGIYCKKSERVAEYEDILGRENERIGKIWITERKLSEMDGGKLGIIYICMDVSENESLTCQ